MKLTVSNIAWSAEEDEAMYIFLQQNGFAGIEIAPTRIFQKNPYDQLQNAKEYAQALKRKYHLFISSMQSIWYGREENIFHSKQERDALFEYTQDAMNFANTIQCANLVFGAPRNRTYQSRDELKEAVPFFKALGEYAMKCNTVLAMEANPSIYHTNYCNTTKEAIELIKEVENEGFLLNLDVGSMIYNHEDVETLSNNAGYIHHVHISEPFLNPIEKRSIHKELCQFLKENDYEGCISLEVKKQEDREALQDMLWYMKEIFS